MCLQNIEFNQTLDFWFDPYTSLEKQYIENSKNE